MFQTPTPQSAASAVDNSECQNNPVALLNATGGSERPQKKNNTLQQAEDSNQQQSMPLLEKINKSTANGNECSPGDGQVGNYVAVDVEKDFNKLYVPDDPGFERVGFSFDYVAPKNLISDG